MAGRTPQADSETRPSKKTEAVEVRVSPEDKADFMAACRARGESASDVLRSAMRRYSGGPPHRRRVLMAMTVLFSTAAAFWMGASLSPQIATPAPNATIDAGTHARVTTAAEAGGIVTDIILSLVSGPNERKVQTSVLADAGESVRIDIDNIPAAELAPVFGPLESEAATLVIGLKARAAGEPDVVVYELSLELYDGSRPLLDAPMTPVLMSRAGDSARIVLGQGAPDGPAAGLEISLTPAPGA